MGMRIRKKWDLPSEQSGALALLAVAFFVGGAAGCLLAGLSGGAGAEELGSYLTGYLALARDGSLPRGLWTVLWGQVKYLLAALILSVTALGVVGLPVLFGVRGKGTASGPRSVWPARPAVGARHVFDGGSGAPLGTAAAAPVCGRGPGRHAPEQRGLLVPGRCVHGPDPGGRPAGVLGGPGAAARIVPRDSVTSVTKVGSCGRV